MAKMWNMIALSALLFNIARMALVLLAAYLALYIVDEDRVEVNIVMGQAPNFSSFMLDEYGSGESNFTSMPTTISKNDTTTTTSMPTTTDYDDTDWNTAYDYGEDESEVDEDSTTTETKWQKSPEVVDPVFLAVAMMEIITMFIITYALMGPFTKKIPIKRWLSSMAWFRIAWKRILFVVVAIVYSQLYLKYREKRYEDSYQNEKYKDSNFRKFVLWVTVVEYFMLGVAESTASLLTAERIKKELLGIKKRHGTVWGNMAVLVYLTGVLASAIRNLFVCLYFAVIAVFVVQDEQDEVSNSSSASGISMFTVVVVLQIVIVLIRGKYGNFFLHLCLGYFLHEGELFKEIMADAEEKEENNHKEENV